MQCQPLIAGSTITGIGMPAIRSRTSYQPISFGGTQPSAPAPHLDLRHGLRIRCGGRGAECAQLRTNPGLPRKQVLLLWEARPARTDRRWDVPAGG